MTHPRLLIAALLGGAALCALATPASAAYIVYSSARNASGAPIARGMVSGPVAARGGVTQVRTDAGNLVSFVGDTRFSTAQAGGISVELGQFTVAGGVNEQIRVGGDIVASVNGQDASASFSVDLGGVFTGRALSGSVNVTSGGVSQSFDVGQAFTAALGSAPRPAVTAGIQPISAPAFDGLNFSDYLQQAFVAAQAAYGPNGVDLQQNPFIYAYPSVDVQSLLAFYAALLGNGGFTLPQAPQPETPVVPPVVTPPVVTPPVVTPPVVTPPTPVTTTATYVGGGFGDAGRIEVELDSNNTIIGFGGRTVTTAQLVNATSNNAFIIGRYANGTVSQTSGGLVSTQTYGANDGISFAYARVLPTALPTTGAATYGIAAFTTPVFADKSAVTGANLTGGLSITFGSAPKLGAAGILTLTNGGAQRYEFQTSGGLSAPSVTLITSGTSLLAFGGAPVTTTDTRCASNCRLTLNLATGGAASNILAGTYSIRGADALLNGALVATTETAVGATPAPVTDTPVTPTPPTPAPTGAPTGTAAYAGRGSVSSLNGSSNIVSVTATADGKLSAIGRQGRGTNTDHENGGLAATIGFTRWSGGTTTAVVAGETVSTIPENGGQHLVWGTPLSARPTTGTATYALAGSTTPTIADGSVAPGVLRSAQLAVDFATSKVGLGMLVGFNGIDYTINTAGGVAAPSVPVGSDGLFISRVAGANPPVVTGGSCTGANCGGAIQGFLAGAGATHAGIAYDFLSASGIVYGAAAFAKVP